MGMKRGKSEKKKRSVRENNLNTYTLSGYCWGVGEYVCSEELGLQLRKLHSWDHLSDFPTDDNRTHTDCRRTIILFVRSTVSSP